MGTSLSGINYKCDAHDTQPLVVHITVIYDRVMP